MILTSCRVICINEKQSAFKAFDLPISLISNEGFAQPIFGANYLHGTCKPLLNSLPGNIDFKIWLMNGGCGTLAPAYLKMVKSCRRNRGRGVEQTVINSYQSGKKAYIDMLINDKSEHGVHYRMKGVSLDCIELYANEHNMTLIDVYDKSLHNESITFDWPPFFATKNYLFVN